MSTAANSEELLALRHQIDTKIEAKASELHESDHQQQLAEKSLAECRDDPELRTALKSRVSGFTHKSQELNVLLRALRARRRQIEHDLDQIAKGIIPPVRRVVDNWWRPRA